MYDASLKVLNRKPKRDLPPISSTRVIAQCPLHIANPYIDKEGWKLMKINECNLHRWILESDEGYLFFARLFTMMFVHSRENGWISFPAMSELFYYHFGKTIDYSKLPIDDPICILIGLQVFC